MVYRSDRLQTLQYATCLTACTTLTSWSFATADNSSSLIGINPAIAVSPDGVVSASYYDGINLFVRFARCLALCSLDANWANGTPDTGPGVGRSSAIVMDGAVRHVVYQDSTGRNLKYATCVATDCLQPTDWTISAVSLADGGQDPAIALGPNHLLAVTYFASTGGTMKYASCSTACITIANWTTFDLQTATTGVVGRGSGLTVDANGRVQAAFIDKGLDRLRYATCSSICTTSSRWRYSTIDEGIAAAAHPSWCQAGMAGSRSCTSPLMAKKCGLPSSASRRGMRNKRRAARRAALLHVDDSGESGCLPFPRRDRLLPRRLLELQGRLEQVLGIG